jgi:hypothetical protein
MDVKMFFTIISLIAEFGVFLPYYINIWKGRARPHLFSWTTWGILTGLGFILSFSEGGGGGSLIFAVQSILCLGIAIYALVKGENNITRIDWIVFISAIIITIFYTLTKNASLSVLLAATIDCLGFIPTFRKSYLKPHDEPMLTYFLACFGVLFSIIALQVYNFVTILYPLTLVITNLVFVIFLFIRRRSIKTKS